MAAPGESRHTAGAQRTRPPAWSRPPDGIIMSTTAPNRLSAKEGVRDPPGVTSIRGSVVKASDPLRRAATCWRAGVWDGVLTPPRMVDDCRDHEDDPSSADGRAVAVVFGGGFKVSADRMAGRRLARTRTPLVVRHLHAAPSWTDVDLMARCNSARAARRTPTLARVVRPLERSPLGGPSGPVSHRTRPSDPR